MGVKAAAVTMGEPEEATEFCGPRAPGVICLSDTQQKAYQTYGLGRAGFMEASGPGVWKASVDLIKGGHTLGVPMGDTRQMPGVFVIDRGGRVLLPYYSKNVGDYPKPEQILGALAPVLATAAG